MKVGGDTKSREPLENIEERVVQLIRERFEGEEGYKFREDAHLRATLLREAGLLYESRQAYMRILAADPDDDEAREALLDIERVKQ